MTKFELTIKPEEFFREKVITAIGKQNVKISQDAEFYLVRVLCDFINPSTIETANGETNVFDVPLTLLLKEALESPLAKQAKIYKALGDTSLYISGYFQDFFNAKAFDMNYYIDLGANAYENMSNLHRERPEQFDLFIELAKNFRTLVDVVAEVSDTLAPQRASSLLNIYDRWTRNQSDRLRKKLESSGFVLTPNKQVQ